jgi:hypothetical protein
MAGGDDRVLLRTRGANAKIESERQRGCIKRWTKVGGGRWQAYGEFSHGT